MARSETKTPKAIFHLLSDTEWMDAEQLSDAIQADWDGCGFKEPEDGPDSLCSAYVGLVVCADNGWVESRPGDHGMEYRLTAVGVAQRDV